MTISELAWFLGGMWVNSFLVAAVLFLLVWKGK